MKKILFLLLVLSAQWGCKEKALNLCDDLIDGLTSEDLQVVKDQLNGWLAELPPVPTDTDPTGHLENLNEFVGKLNSTCGINASFTCYACIKTLPAETEVLVSFKKDGNSILRTLDISTPKETVMTIASLHQ